MTLEIQSSMCSGLPNIRAAFTHTNEGILLFTSVSLHSCSIFNCVRNMWFFSRKSSSCWVKYSSSSSFSSRSFCAFERSLSASVTCNHLSTTHKQALKWRILEIGVQIICDVKKNHPTTQIHPTFRMQVPTNTKTHTNNGYQSPKSD